MADPTPMQLLTYTVMDANYLNGKLMNMRGVEDAVPATQAQAGSVGTVGNPTQSRITIDSLKQDPVVFSFVYGNGTKELRMLLVTIVTPSPPGVPSTQAFYSLLKMDTDGDWTPLGTNVQLVGSDGTTTCARNPHGVAQIGNMLYIIDYDTQMIYLLGGDALNGQTGGTYQVSAFNIGSEASLPENARSQALIALNNSLFALYLDCTADGETHELGILVRVGVSGQNNTSLAVNAKTLVGKNPQMIIPLNPSSASPILLIPAIGGKQEDQGLGNYGESNITKIPAFDPTWDEETEPILISNAPAAVPVPEPNTPPAVSYTLDLQAIAASGDTGDNEIVYILAGIYQGSWATKKYALWKTTVGKLNSLTANTTVLAAYTAGKLSPAETGDVPGYFWDIFYENKGGGQVGRLWFLRGSPILVTEAADYGSGSISFGRGTAAGQIGGQNVNSVDLTAETARQVQAAVSLKRGLRAQKPAMGTPKAATTVAAEEEEE